MESQKGTDQSSARLCVKPSTQRIASHIHPTNVPSFCIDRALPEWESKAARACIQSQSSRKKYCRWSRFAEPASCETLWSLISISPRTPADFKAVKKSSAVFCVKPSVKIRICSLFMGTPSCTDLLLWREHVCGDFAANPRPDRSS
jgi:hypothetical protein